ncbi:MAG: LpxL/LpxP family Kdo(2)-lipid IV(A) lauroyl/palmitoleoyl acyltransferase [Pseudomonadota bacterium]
MIERASFTWRLLHPRYWPTWLAVGALWLISQLPYRAIFHMGRGLGRVMLRTAKRRRRIAKVNLKMCFPELSSRQREALLTKNFESTALAVFETAMSWWWPHWRLRRLVTIEGLDHLQDHAQQGVILLAMHFTTLEIGAGLLSMHYSIDGLHRRHQNAVLDYLQQRGRERHNAEGRTIARGDIRAMIKALRQHRVVWFAPDQDMGRKHAVFVPFFGKPAATITTTATLAAMTGAAVIPFTQTRRDDGRGYHLTIHPPLAHFPFGDDRLDAYRINNFIEAQVRRQPEQYLWVHRRFKTTPNQAPSPYAMPVKDAERDDGMAHGGAHR